MPFQCQLCEKVLPTRTGIWNHLKNKHPEVSEKTQEGDQPQIKRRKLDKYIICKDPVKPVQSQPGRPVDDSLELKTKIKMKSETNNEDISLKTMMNSHTQQILNYIATMIEEKNLKQYIRDPSEDYRPQPLDIKEEMSAQSRKFIQFLNRIKILFNQEINSKIDEYSKNLDDVLLEIEKSNEDEIIKTIFSQALQYSKCL